MQTKDVEALVRAIENRGFKPEGNRDNHVMGMARQAILFKKELKWPEDMQLQAIYRRVYANL